MFTKRVMVAMGCTLLLAACDDAPQEQAPTPPTAAQIASAKNALPPEMVAAVSAGKSATVIGVHFAMRNLPTVGKPLSIDIAIVPHVPFETMRVAFEARDGVALSQGSTLGPLSDAPPEKPIKHQIVLQPVREGIFMVTATVDTEGGEGSISRVFSIPVIVGASAAGAEAAPANAPAAPIPGEPAATPPPAN